jgi:hypothetical protein
MIHEFVLASQVKVVSRASAGLEAGRVVKAADDAEVAEVVVRRVRRFNSP